MVPFLVEVDNKPNPTRIVLGRHANGGEVKGGHLRFGMKIEPKF